MQLHSEYNTEQQNCWKGIDKHKKKNNQWYIKTFVIKLPSQSSYYSSDLMLCMIVREVHLL